jgi:cbb3-type cytochrome oxidase cytochrome c subunit
MPVPTDTFRNMKRLNLIFAASALVLLIGTMLLVLADYNREWRQYQRAGIAWQVAMTTEAAAEARDATVLQEKAQLEAQRAELQLSLPHQEIASLQAEYAKAQEEKKKLDLIAAVKKGEIGPLTQQIERLMIERAPGDRELTRLIERRARIETDYQNDAVKIDAAERAMASARDRIDEKKAEVLAIQRQIDEIERRINTVNERLATLNPTGPAKLGKIIRDAPLLDWFNPSEKVQQVVVPGVHIDLNFMTVETVDRCQSCHVNIDNPAFEENNLLMFAERQLARSQGQDVDAINHPVVMREFWEDAARIAGLERGLATARTTALAAINAMRQAKGKDAITTEQFDVEFDRIAVYLGDDRAEWYRPLGYYITDLKTLLKQSVGEAGFAQLRSLYRHELVTAYNAARKPKGLPELSASPVLLGHPRLDLYVEAESKHPMKLVGCTSCHEGAGQETQFVHTAHTPRDIWVDAATGAPVPKALIMASGTRDEMRRLLRQGPAMAKADDAPAKAAGVQLASTSADAAAIAVASAAAATTDAHGHGKTATIVQHDVNLANPHAPGTFGPEQGFHGEAAAYRRPGSDATAMAVSQETYWTKAFGWHHIHFMHWEKPMHSLDYVESSCNRCHTGVFDIKDEAPQLYEGRKLFVQVGCAGCHVVEDVIASADFKLMGPSLTHVKHKLSHEMLASWIWSPKAFRPMTRMPHFFMLENNSTPADILRTRVETTAMSHYLLHAEPKASYYTSQGKAVPKYEPEAPPEVDEEKAKDAVARGRIIFNNVGCLACHTNMEEHGEQWIVDDLMQRQGLSRDDAQAAYRALGDGQPDGGYNARQWYAMEHLQHRITQVGPEISGVGTKLLAGRTPEQARQWAYDWVRNPQHYSDYSIMPSLRLSESEASDLAAYLLAQKRPGYTPDAFEMGNEQRIMLDALIEQLDPARTVSRKPEDQNQRLMFLGEKMIGHYGCNGCHVVPGMEDLAPIGTSLDGWALKDPHTLDFGYFDHAFDRARRSPFTIHRVKHEGLTSDAPHITHTSDKLTAEPVVWEDMHGLERRPWLYHKLHNTRVYDRGRTQLHGSLATDGQTGVDPGKPYDKLKMPKFYFTDEQTRALVTFVTSIRKPLVDSSLMVGTTPENRMLAHGRQVAEMYNCYGCHNVEGNDVLVQQFYDVLRPDGSFNYDHLNNAPPRLLGQGSKTQPDWLAYFLNNVHPLRPWLRIRMPSYPLDGKDTQHLNDYFAAASLTMAEQLHGVIEPIMAYRANAPTPDAAWWDVQSLDVPVRRLKAWGLKLDLVRPAQVDPRQSSESDRRNTWNKLLQDAAFLANLNEIPYPFPMTPRPQMSPEEFARGEMLFNELRCYQCHAVGDEHTLAMLHELESKGRPAAPADDADDDDDPYGAPAAAADDDDDDPYGAPAEATTTARGPTVEDVLPVQLIGGKLYTAPNLIYTANRLRRDWFHKWLMEPLTMQPGTAMPQWFPAGHSAFANFPAAAKEKAESLYGFTGEDQMRLLLDYVYAVGFRNYTPGAEKLYGVERPKVEVTALERPAPREGEPTPEPGATPEAAAPAAPVEVPQRPAVEATTSSIELHDGTSDFEGTRVVGVIKFDGRPARRRPVRMDQDPFCRDAHTGQPPVLDEVLVVNDKGELKNAFVVVKSGLGAGPFEIPDDKKQPMLDQVGCVYLPHVKGMVAGQDLLILNSDNTLHNVKMDSSNNGSFNEGMPVAGMQMRKPFNRPEMGIKFACNVHPWMSATLHVVEHPFFAVSDVEGRYEIKGLPPGRYTIEVVHDRTTTGMIEVTVEANKSVRTDASVAGR